MVEGSAEGGGVDSATTTNPVFGNFALPKYSGDRLEGGHVERMTLNGTIHKTGILLVCFTVSALWSWAKVPSLTHMGSNSAKRVFFAAFLVCALGAWALVWLAVRKKKWAAEIAAAYALLQGAVMGIVSAGSERRYPGIAIQAVGLTIAMCFCLLLAYRSGLIRVTESFNRKLAMATGGVVLFYFARFVLALVGIRTLSVFAVGVPGILITAMIVVIAGFSLVSDFDFAAQSAKADFPKYMEWYAALGLRDTDLAIHGNATASDEGSEDARDCLESDPPNLVCRARVAALHDIRSACRP